MSDLGRIRDKHRPQGYSVTETRRLKTHWGFSERLCRIVCVPIVDRHSLFVFLHECGHIHSRHVSSRKGLPAWREEYEADQYAIGAMRAEGLSIPRETMAERKKLLRELIVEAHHNGDTIDEEVLKYAYGRDWRKHK